MPIRVFSIAARSSNSDEERELNDFMSRHRIVSLSKQFVADGSNSFWSLCVDYLPQSADKSDRPDRAGKRPQVDYRETLSATDFTIFADLRELRKAIANRDGVPIYTIFTNQQLADLVTGRVATKQDFSKINGVGASRIDKHGDAFLETLLRHRNGEHETSAQPVPQDS